MSITTNLRGRLRNTLLQRSKGLLPVFEAVVNSIHAIEDADLQSDQGNIKIEILRNNQLEFDQEKPGTGSKGDIEGFKITDNGIGFDEDNMESFRTLDSVHKFNRGGRGVGRLLWLKAFRQVDISSTFKENKDKLMTRDFVFDPENGIANEKTSNADNNSTSTCVYLKEFVERYRRTSPKTAEAIANHLFEHCLWYFVREGGAPHITISDGEDQVNLDDVYEKQMVEEANTETIQIKEREFELIHIKLTTSSSQNHSIAFCAANRLVKGENIKGKIPGLFGKLHDKKSDFIYACYVTSSFFNEQVTSERTDFNIEEEPSPLFIDELSMNDIKEEVIKRAESFLADYLQDNKQKSRKCVQDFANNKAPRYRPIIKHISETELYSIDPDISNSDLDLSLHKHLYNLEAKMLIDGHKLMSPGPNVSEEDYEKRLQEFQNIATDLKKSDLANYVFHRKVIIDLLKMAIQRRDDGTYQREDLIHNLIMPMRRDSTEIPLEHCNLWLIDERLAFHDYLASDKPLSGIPITNSAENIRPDLAALNVFDNPTLVSERDRPPLASIVVVELKKPMRDDASPGGSKDPIEQTLGYLNRIRKGKVTTSDGRLIPNSDKIPGFCYVLCDITDSIKELCEGRDAILTDDGLGYFFYHKHYNAYVEVTSFDRLVNAAKERNRAFFDKLGLPAT